MDDYVIEVENLTKIFYPQKRLSEFIRNPFKKTIGLKVLDRVNLKVKRNEIFCLVGPNGAGKTTIIKILAGLILADSGRVKVLNLDVIKDELKLKA
ncbi:MAG: ATP-binding cassette domain-containing protein, partial [Candidatus Omnitrophica bacterium]|nr:ATP-binding cassette domain-containing protein [Candidatus Omnitrophota bacterium]